MISNFYWILALVLSAALAGYFWALYQKANEVFPQDEICLALIFAFLFAFGMILFLWIAITLWNDYRVIALFNGVIAFAFAVFVFLYGGEAVLDFFVYWLSPLLKEKLGIPK
jgi:apolipoprotein N-acyltransferase